MKIPEVLKSWVSVNKFLLTATEKEALKLLEAEKTGQQRLSVLVRLYGRYNMLRTHRERSELLKGNK